MTTATSMQKFTLAGLIKEYEGGIRIPMIQRDYAQGRPSWKNPRNRFLADFKKALAGGKPLHLDFVYGIKQDEDGVGAFCPLDGQQRLTTLFLLHWSLSARDGCFEEFQGAFRKGSPQFSYQVRPGGRAFFHALVEHAPSADEWKTIKPTAWFRQQSWFRSIWEQDPSVAGALVMLDAIHEHFKDHPEASFRNLMDGDRITFQRLDLKAVGLHDDLYLSMNARGRPLSTFETFKARLDKLLETEFTAAGNVKSAKDFAHHIDNEWLDFIWNRYGPMESDSEDTSSIDKAFINLFRAVALVSLEPTREDTAKTIKKEDLAKMDSSYVQSLSTAEPDYDDFENGGWLTTKFTSNLIHVLKACEFAKEHDADPVNNFSLYQSPWFGEGNLLDRIVGRESKLPFLTDYLQFAACVRFIAVHGPVLKADHLTEFKEWNRVVRNLVLNSDIRADTFLDRLSGLDHLLNGSKDKGILAFLANAEGKLAGFNELPTKEECLKAQLILSDSTWQECIEKAEDHGYFRGQIGFLLEFSGATVDNAESQARFQSYLARAEEMFTHNGLSAKPDFLWERALLAIGNYFCPHGSSHSFLENSTGPLSWKRLLSDPNNKKRRYLKDLWDSLETDSLEKIAQTATGDLWRNTLCTLPEAWDYCKQRLIRLEVREGLAPRVFLLSGQRLSGRYAELFTFRLRLKEDLKNYPDRFKPLVFTKANHQTGSGDDPHLCFQWQTPGHLVEFRLYCQIKNDIGFSLWIPIQTLDPILIEPLKSVGFATEPEWKDKYLVIRQQEGTPLDGASFLQKIADALSRSSILHPS